MGSKRSIWDALCGAYSRLEARTASGSCALRSALANEASHGYDNDENLHDLGFEKS